jgi:hypothetical protein
MLYLKGGRWRCQEYEAHLPKQAVAWATAAAVLLGSVQPSLAMGVVSAAGTETSLRIAGHPVETLVADASGSPAITDALLSRAGDAPTV